MNAGELRTITYEVRPDGVALITLNRPDRLNAWTVRMAAEYRWALTEADADPVARVAVVTGAGRGFCAGADFKALDGMAAGIDYRLPDTLPNSRQEQAEIQPDADARMGQHSWPLDLGIPLIAAVNGAAAGVGLVLACFADIRFAAVGAKLTTSSARLGLPAEHGLSWILPRLIGAGRAADLLLSGRIVLAEEAAEMGLVNRVYPAEELLPETLAYAAEMAAVCSPAAMATTKRQLWADTDGGLDEAVKTSERLLLEMIKQPDFIEAAAARQEHRPPKFAPVRIECAAPAEPDPRRSPSRLRYR